MTAQGTEITLDVRNPPTKILRQQLIGMGFDALNASPVGRAVSGQLRAALVTPSRATPHWRGSSPFSGQTKRRAPPTAEDLLALIELGDYRGGLSIRPMAKHWPCLPAKRVRENAIGFSWMSSAGGSPREIADAATSYCRDNSLA